MIMYIQMIYISINDLNNVDVTVSFLNLHIASCFCVWRIVPSVQLKDAESKLIYDILKLIGV